MSALQSWVGVSCGYVPLSLIVLCLLVFVLHCWVFLYVTLVSFCLFLVLYVWCVAAHLVGVEISLSLIQKPSFFAASDTFLTGFPFSSVLLSP